MCPGDDNKLEKGETTFYLIFNILIHFFTNPQSPRILVHFKEIKVKFIWLMLTLRRVQTPIMHSNLL
jgi:hypothetical protein